MGQSTNAMLFYGYCWQDEDNDFGTDMEAVVRAILKSRGMADPWDEHYTGDQPYENYKAWAATPEGSVEVEAYRAAETQVKAELGVEWGSHCSGDYSIPYLFILGTETTAYRGTAQPITEDLNVDPKWRERGWTRSSPPRASSLPRVRISRAGGWRRTGADPSTATSLLDG